jgi:hypothetical protein
MFYLLSTRGHVEKTESGYRVVQRQLLAMRREKEICYGWIADNTCWQRKPASWEGLGAFFEQSAQFYRSALWAKSPAYVEVWCEKDAISSVLYDVTSVYDVPLMVARGYASESFAYEAAEKIANLEKPTFIYYIGDLDPSGWHMSADCSTQYPSQLGFVDSGRANTSVPILGTSRRVSPRAPLRIGAKPGQRECPAFRSVPLGLAYPSAYRNGFTTVSRPSSTFPRCRSSV